MSTEISPGQAPLERLVANGADSSELADAALGVWYEVSAALRPIVGARGVAALLERSLHLSHSAHPWLPSHVPRVGSDGDFDLLREALASQTSLDALAAHTALLRTSHSLLTTLIGAALTERLLRSVGHHLAPFDNTPRETPP